MGAIMAAVADTDRIFHALLGAAALGGLVPLLALSLAALVVTLRAWSRHLRAAD
ncbi:hypothetical protein ABZW30_41525 [Kitasatospora sp. NPDC004669]|uniref:hypothetical protein n=1 Tax=Kitasatospora sp. NPDC004669 TaxID=3154555 RepID=UPI0033B74066